MKKILFLCRENSARSQMAEGIVNSLFKDKYKAFSAGVELKEVHPLAIEVMKEIGIDISNHKSKHLNQFSGEEFDYVITVCAGDLKGTCPFFPGKAGKRLSWAIPDPAEKGDIESFRRARDEILERIKKELMGI
jgi:arsenate reductase